MSKIYLNLLDLPNNKNQLKLINEKRKRKAVTKLLEIHDARNKAIGLPISTGEANSLESYMLTRITNKKTALPISIESNTIKVSIILIPGYGKQKSYTDYLKPMLTRITSRNWIGQVSIGLSDEHYVSFIEDSEESDYRYETLSKLITGIEMLLRNRRYVCNDWVNINLSAVFSEQNLDEVERDFVKYAGKFYISHPKVKTLYGNIPLEEFVMMIGGSSTQEADSDYYILDIVSDLNHEMMPNYNLNTYNKLKDLIVTLIISAEGELKLRNGCQITDLYYDIVQLTSGYGPNTLYQMKMGVLVAANAIVSSNNVRPFHGDLINTLQSRLQSEVEVNDHIWVSAVKGGGKSSIIKRLPHNYLVIDSDVKAKLMTLMVGDSTLRDRVLRMDFADGVILDLIYEICQDKDDVYESLYESLANNFCLEYKIAMNDVVNGKISPQLISKFKMILAREDKMLSQAAFSQFAGVLRNYLNVKLKLGLTKTIQFCHNSNECYPAMSNCLYDIVPWYNPSPLHIKRVRRTSPIVQCFLGYYYGMFNTFTTTQVNLHMVNKMFGVEMNGTGS